MNIKIQLTQEANTQVPSGTTGAISLQLTLEAPRRLASSHHSLAREVKETQGRLQGHAGRRKGGKVGQKELHFFLPSAPAPATGTNCLAAPFIHPDHPSVDP